VRIASLPPDEDQRLAALREYEILDTDAEKEYDEIVRLAAHICGVPIAGISFLDAGRQWFKASIGLAFPETCRDTSFCSHAILGDDLTMDVALGRLGGARTILVASGISGRLALDAIPERRRPDAVVGGVAELLDWL